MIVGEGLTIHGVGKHTFFLWVKEMSQGKAFDIIVLPLGGIFSLAEGMKYYEICLRCRLGDFYKFFETDSFPFDVFYRSTLNTVEI